MHRKPVIRQNPVYRIPQVLQSIQKRAIQIKDNRRKFFQKTPAL